MSQLEKNEIENATTCPDFSGKARSHQVTQSVKYV